MEVFESFIWDEYLESFYVIILNLNKNKFFWESVNVILNMIF